MCDHSILSYIGSTLAFVQGWYLGSGCLIQVYNIGLSLGFRLVLLGSGWVYVLAQLNFGSHLGYLHDLIVESVKLTR